MNIYGPKTSQDLLPVLDLHKTFKQIKSINSKILVLKGLVKSRHELGRIVELGQRERLTINVNKRTDLGNEFYYAKNMRKDKEYWVPKMFIEDEIRYKKIL